MRSMRLTSSYDGTMVAIVPSNVGNVFRPPTLDYTIIRPASGGLPDIHVAETPDVVFHKLDAALAETIMTESTDAESYSGLGQRMTEGFDHVVEAISTVEVMISEVVHCMPPHVNP